MLFVVLKTRKTFLPDVFQLITKGYRAISNSTNNDCLSLKQLEWLIITVDTYKHIQYCLSTPLEICHNHSIFT